MKFLPIRGMKIIWHKLSLKLSMNASGILIKPLRLKNLIHRNGNWANTNDIVAHDGILLQYYMNLVSFFEQKCDIGQTRLLDHLKINLLGNWVKNQFRHLRKVRNKCGSYLLILLCRI